MKQPRLILLKIGILFLSINLYAQTRLIFDTDFGDDANDLGALAMDQDEIAAVIEGMMLGEF